VVGVVAAEVDRGYMIGSGAGSRPFWVMLHNGGHDL
jgi:hypothetical protein